MFSLENLKLVVILSALLYGFLFGQLISDVSFTNRRLSLWCSHTPLNMCWLIIYMKDIHSKFLFFREVQRNSELKQYIEDQQIQEQNISHTKLERKN